MQEDQTPHQSMSELAVTAYCMHPTWVVPSGGDVVSTRDEYVIALWWKYKVATSRSSITSYPYCLSSPPRRYAVSKLFPFSASGTTPSDFTSCLVYQAADACSAAFTHHSPSTRHLYIRHVFWLQQHRHRLQECRSIHTEEP